MNIAPDIATDRIALFMHANAASALRPVRPLIGLEEKDHEK
jgi:hypothetical protein